MRIQTKRDCEEQNRRWRLRGEVIDQLGAEKAEQAEQLTETRQWLDRWRGRALAAEENLRKTAAAMRAAHQKMAAENAELRAELAKTREDDGDCDD